MIASSLVQQWRDAQLRFFEVEKCEDHHARLAGMQELREEWKRIFDQLSEIAEAGDPDTWLCIGEGYSIGLGTAPDREQAKRWFRRAAEAGNTRAMVRLACK